ncbi:MAG: N-acetyl-gamma-glutamyl-phosphate reductase [Verrucomicrobia bacterium]|nr:N-acetyl-gamma-glutamyl-phosphate reductase [Verrucomicrobiota bacterium]
MFKKSLMHVRIAILGASGYSGEELVRLLLRHPRADLVCVTSRQNAGKALGEIFPKFAGHPAARSLRFIEPELNSIRHLIGSRSRLSAVFLALPHGVAAEWAVPLVKEGFRVIDLSADFRLTDAACYKEFYGHSHPAPGFLGRAVYGLPEIHRAAIRKARFVASPGCYPTSILVPLVPLLRADLIQPHGMIADSLSGVSGAGRKAEDAYLFCECNESARAYGVPKHRHLSEIEQELSRAARQRVVIQFTPHLIPVNRGILTTLYVQPRKKGGDISAAIEQCYQKAYGREPFVRLLDSSSLPDLKNVVGSNTIEITHRADPRTGRVLLFSAVDNLTKGAAGQAVQAMNILCGFPETEGLC